MITMILFQGPGSKEETGDSIESIEYGNYNSADGIYDIS